MRHRVPEPEPELQPRWGQPGLQPEPEPCQSKAPPTIMAILPTQARALPSAALLVELALLLSSAASAAPVAAKPLQAGGCAAFPATCFVRHFNRSVVPERCGEIDLAALLPKGFSSAQAQAYVSVTTLRVL